MRQTVKFPGKEAGEGVMGDVNAVELKKGGERRRDMTREVVEGEEKEFKG